MAFALKIIACTKEGQEVEIAPSWWNIKELRRTYNFEEVTDQHYRDYILYVDQQRLQQIIIDQEKYRDQGVYQYESWKKINAETLAELNKLISKLTNNDSIKIRIYEWESGLD